MDISSKIGQLYSKPQSEIEWPMYSFDRAAYTLWNAIANEFEKRGWSEQEILEWLQSKAARWALDGRLGELIEKAGVEFAAGVKGKGENSVF